MTDVQSNANERDSLVVKNKETFNDNTSTSEIDIGKTEDKATTVSTGEEKSEGTEEETLGLRKAAEVIDKESGSKEIKEENSNTSETPEEIIENVSISPTIEEEEETKSDSDLLSTWEKAEEHIEESIETETTKNSNDDNKKTSQPDSVSAEITENVSRTDSEVTDSHEATNDQMDDDESGKEKSNMERDSKSASTTIIEPNRKRQREEGEEEMGVASAESSKSRPKSPEQVPSISRAKSPELLSKVYERFPDVCSIPRDENRTPMEFIFKKVMALLLHSLNIHFTSSLIEDISNLGISFLSKMISDLHNVTEIQRRRKPLKSDLKILFMNRQFDVAGLESEVTRGKRVTEEVEHFRDKLQDETLNVFNQFKKPIEEVIQIDDSSAPFFYNQTYEISELVPLSSKQKAYIPSWLPAFPPDHTHRTTPQYIDRITDPKKLREKLVEEGKLSEQALQRLMSADDRISIINTAEENEIEDEADELSDEDSILSDGGNRNEVTSITDNELSEPAKPSPSVEALKENVAVPHISLYDLSTPPPLPDAKQPPTSKRFDIEAYAKKRLDSIKAREAHMIDKQQDKEQNVFLKAEKYISPYSTNPITEAITEMFNNIMDEEYNSVLREIKVAEKKRTKTVAKLLKKKKAKEEFRKLQENKEDFNFNFEANDKELDFEFGGFDEPSAFDESKVFHLEVADSDKPVTINDSQLTGGLPNRPNEESAVELTEDIVFTVNVGEAENRIVVNSVESTSANRGVQSDDVTPVSEISGVNTSETVLFENGSRMPVSTQNVEGHPVKSDTIAIAQEDSDGDDEDMEEIEFEEV